MRLPRAALSGILLFAGCGDRLGWLHQSVGGTGDLAVVSAQIATRVKPEGTLGVTIKARNTGATHWSPKSVKLVYAGEGRWKGSTLALDEKTSPAPIT